MNKLIVATALVGLMGLGFAGTASADDETPVQQTAPKGKGKPRRKPPARKGGGVQSSALKCERSKLQELQAAVTGACKNRREPFSCARGRFGKAALETRKANALACKEARVAVQTECFGETDKGHQGAIDQAQKAADTCAQKLEALGNRGDTTQKGPGGKRGRGKPRKQTQEN